MGKQGKKRKHDPREERLEKGRALLAQWGVHDFTLAADTPAERALGTLAPLTGRDPAADLVIAGWLGRFADPAVAAKLVEWESRTADKDLRREIRRSLFRLEQKGIAARRAEEPRPAFSLAAESQEPRGYMGAVDGDGSRMAWLLRSDRGTMTALFTVLNDREGMTYVDAVTARRQALMRTVKESIGAQGPLVEVPWRYAHAHMGAAFQKGAPRPSNMKADYLLNRGEITQEEPEPVPPCPVLEELPQEETSDPGLLETSADLFKEREFATWALPADRARHHIEEYARASNSGLVVSKEAATERVVGIMDKALEELAAGELRLLVVRRLEETAWILFLRGRKDSARRALAVARAMAAPEAGRLKDISFLRAFVFRAFAPYLAPRDKAPPEEKAAQGASELAEGSSRIIDPSKIQAVDEPGEEQPGPDDDPSLIIRP